MLDPDMSQRRHLLDQAISIQRGTVIGGNSDRIKAGNHHLLLLRERIRLDDGQQTEALLREAVTLALELASDEGVTDLSFLAKAHSYYVQFASLAVDFLEEYRDPSKQIGIVNDALKLRTAIGDKRLVTSLLAESAHALALLEETDPQTLEALISSAIESARATKDGYLIGRALWVSCYRLKWLVVADHDDKEASSHYNEVIAKFEEARKYLQPISDASSQYFLALTYTEAIEAHTNYANFLPEWSLRKQVFEEGVRIFRESPFSKNTIAGSATTYLGHAGAQAIRWLASFEDNRNRRKELLMEASAIAQEVRATSQRVEPTFLWNLGLRHIQEGTIRLDLARETTEAEMKRGELRIAVERLQEGLRILAEDRLFSAPGKPTVIGDFNSLCANALNTLFEVTGDSKIEQEQLQFLEASARSYSTGKKYSRAAEVRWRKAAVLGHLGRHEEASSEYQLAADEYGKVSKELDQFGQFYLSYVAYMRAWSHIEAARHNSDSGKYSEASSLHRTAAAMLKKARRWSYLSYYHKAWSIFEKANHLSVNDKTSQARMEFQKARSAFTEATKRLGVTSDLDQVKGEAERVQKYSALLADYCSVRALIERSKAMVERGEFDTGSKLYERSADLIDNMAQRFPDADQQTEISVLAPLCLAWASFSKAEVSRNPDHYVQAAELFERARNVAGYGRQGHLIDGNAALSKAIALMIRFMDTADQSQYAEAKACLDRASNAFSQARVEKYLRWTVAAQKLLDGYMYARQAERHVDSAQKADFYRYSEENLSLASREFAAAGDAKRAEEAQNQLARIRKLKAPYIKVREPSPFPPPIGATLSIPFSSSEPAAGLKAFEGANVQAIAEYPSVIELEEEFTIRIDLINVGKVATLLLRIEQIVPSEFTLARIPESCRLEDGSIVFDGRRLEPMKTESYLFHAVPKHAGPFRLAPRIVYVDEKGAFATKLVEPTLINVRRWPEVELENKDALRILDHLLKSFLADRDLRRVRIEDCGWRTATDVISHSKVPKAAIYGRKGAARIGPCLMELLSRGFVEVRHFTGERGRSGRIMKIRIAHENEQLAIWMKKGRLMKT